MSGKKFFGFLGVVFVIALVVYVISTPRGNDMPLIGVVDGNEVIVSPQITGRIVKLTVDEGSEVKQGQIVAELDRTELETQVASAEANTRSLEAKIQQDENSYHWTNDQTGAAVSQAQSNVTSAQAQLDEARADLRRDELNTHRTVGLFESGIVSAQDRDTAVATLEASQAHVKSLEDQVKAQRGGLGITQANRRQLEVVQSEIQSFQAQVAQAKADKDRVVTQLGYTEIAAPIDGIVSVRVAKQGEVVLQGSPIVVVVDVDHLWVRADVEEGQIDRITYGQKLRVQLPSGDILEGSVFFKAVESDFATQRDVSRTKRDIKTFAIKVAVPNPGRRLFTGMTATVLLPQTGRRSWFHGFFRAGS
jgi:HlyD family secretion protein